jgi:hypothetical protein
MEDFDVRAKSTTILSSSTLVDELSMQSQKYRSFPVIINGYAQTFHDVRGGYDERNDQQVVKLVQYHDNMASSSRDTQAAVYEVNLDDSFLLYADEHHTFDDEEEFVVCLAVSDYEQISNEERKLW